MRNLMISAAVLALLAVPAMAQTEPPGSRGKASISRQGGPQAAPAPQPAPAPQAAPAPVAQAAPAERGGRGERGGDRGNRGGAQQGAPQPQAAPQPAAQPQGQITDRSGNRGPSAQPDNHNRDDRMGNGRDGNRDWRGNDRDRRSDGWRNDSRGNGFGNRPGFNGQRRDFSSFRDYHRTFRAPQRYRAPSYRRPSGWYSHRWTFGEMLPSLFWGRDYWLYEYEDYGLPTPPYGAVWVRVANDALMIDQDSGEVITVAYNVFY